MLIICRILKVGVGIGNDTKIIWRCYGVEVRGVVDLQTVAFFHGFSGKIISC